MRRYDDTRALGVCRTALVSGRLTRDKTGWRFGRRRFPFHIVRTLIDAGEALVVGEYVVRWSPANA